MVCINLINSMLDFLGELRQNIIKPVLKLLTWTFWVQMKKIVKKILIGCLINCRKSKACKESFFYFHKTK